MDWKEETRDKVKKLTLHGDYRSALKLSRKALKKDPHDFLFQLNYAKILGDWSDELPLTQRKKYKLEAILILKSLLKRLRGKDPLVRFSACLNYYYQSEDFYGMYAYGKRLEKMKTLKQQAFYAQGLAASYLGFNFVYEGRVNLGQKWGEKAICSWSRYDLNSEKYYFAHYSYAKACAAAGRKSLARVAIKKAARLGKRDLGDWEFADVMELIKKLPS